MNCPRDDCDLELRPDPFMPPGTFMCPTHGGPLWFEEEIQLATEHSGRHASEMEAFTSWLARLQQRRTLRYSVVTDSGGVHPTAVTIENHGRDEVDVRFEFDAQSGALLNVRAYIDPRARASR